MKFHRSLLFLAVAAAFMAATPAGRGDESGGPDEMKAEERLIGGNVLSVLTHLGNTRRGPPRVQTGKGGRLGRCRHSALAE